MTKKIILATTIVSILLLVWFIVIIEASLGKVNEKTVIAQVEKRIDASIPKDAEVIEYNMNTYLDFAAYLRFRSSPESTLTFAEQICDGVLRKGYNPFTKVSYKIPRENLPDVYIFENQGNQYFAYPSPSTPATQYGNQCLKPAGSARTFTQIELLIDTENTEFYEVSLFVQ